MLRAQRSFSLSHFLRAASLICRLVLASVVLLLIRPSRSGPAARYPPRKPADLTWKGVCQRVWLFHCRKEEVGCSAMIIATFLFGNRYYGTLEYPTSPVPQLFQKVRPTGTACIMFLRTHARIGIALTLTHCATTTARNTYDA